MAPHQNATTTRSGKKTRKFLTSDDYAIPSTSKMSYSSFMAPLARFMTRADTLSSLNSDYSSLVSTVSNTSDRSRAREIKHRTAPNKAWSWKSSRSRSSSRSWSRSRSRSASKSRYGSKSRSELQCKNTSRASSARKGPSTKNNRQGRATHPLRPLARLEAMCSIASTVTVSSLWSQSSRSSSNWSSSRSRSRSPIRSRGQMGGGRGRIARKQTSNLTERRVTRSMNLNRSGSVCSSPSSSLSSSRSRSGSRISSMSRSSSRSISGSRMPSRSRSSSSLSSRSRSGSRMSSKSRSSSRMSSRSRSSSRISSRSRSSSSSSSGSSARSMASSISSSSSSSGRVETRGASVRAAHPQTSRPGRRAQSAPAGVRVSSSRKAKRPTPANYKGRKVQPSRDSRSTATKTGKVTKRRKAPRLTMVKKKQNTPARKAAFEKVLREEATRDNFILSDLEWSPWKQAIRYTTPPPRNTPELWESRQSDHLGFRRNVIFPKMNGPAVVEFAVSTPEKQKVPVLGSVTMGTNGRHWEGAFLSKPKLRNQIDRVLKRGCKIYARRAPFSARDMPSIYEKCPVERKGKGSRVSTAEAVSELRGLMLRVVDYAWREHYDNQSRTYSHRPLKVDRVKISD